MSAPTMQPEVSLKRTENCVFILTNFHMGIGKMRQIRGLKVETDADTSKLRHQKQLIDSPELEEIRSQDGKLKRWLDGKTCRYTDSMGFLPRTELSEVDAVLVAYQSIRRPKLVAAFMEKYRELEAQDFAPLRTALGEHFNRADYPHSDVVQAGFEFYFAYKPVGDLNGLQGIRGDILAREVEKEKQVRMQAILEWRDAMRQTAYGMVDALLDVLKPESDGRRKRLYDTTVEKLQDFIASYESRDLADDTEFQPAIQAIRNIMKGVNVEKLRHSDNLKDLIASRLEAVKIDLQPLVVATGRKFR